MQPGQQLKRGMHSPHLVHSIHEGLILCCRLEGQVGMWRALHVWAHNVHAVAAQSR